VKVSRPVSAVTPEGMLYCVAVAAKEARAFWMRAFSERAEGEAAAVKEASSPVTYAAREEV
jgi:hypothetical protein